LQPGDLVKLDKGQWIPANQIKGLNWPTSDPHQEPFEELDFSWIPSANKANKASPEQPQEPASNTRQSTRPAENMDFATGAVRHKNSTRKLSKTPTNILAIFDWRFQYYLTPWIIRVIWVICLVITFFILTTSTLGLFVSILPDSQSSSSSMNWGGGHKPPLESFLPDWLSLGLARAILYGFSVVMLIVGVLVTRMILEMMIVSS
jgi:hypothetical protein